MYSLPSSLGNTPDPTHKNQQHRRSPLSSSSILSEQSQQQTTVPPLPPYLDKLIDQPWSKEASLLLDSWLWYIQQEFELVGGEV